MITDTAIIQGIITASLFAVIYGTGKIISQSGLVLKHLFFSRKKWSKKENDAELKKFWGLFFELVIAQIILLSTDIYFKDYFEPNARGLLHSLLLVVSLSLVILFGLFALSIYISLKRNDKGRQVAKDSEKKEDDTKKID